MIKNQHILNTVKLVLFVLIFTYILDKLVYLTLNKLSDSVMSGQSIGKLNHYLKVKDTLQLVAFGNSRANHHIDVELLSGSSFNNGMDGSSIGYSSTLIKLLPTNKKQKVILHLDPKNMFDSLYIGEDIRALMAKYHRNDIIKTQINNLNQEDAMQWFYWSLDYNGKVLGILKNLYSPKYNYKNYNGYDPISVSDSQKQMMKIVLEQSETEECQDTLTVNKIAMSFLDDVNNFCKKNNKELVIITSPTYYDGCKNDNDALKKILKNLNVSYFDMSDLLKDNNSIDYWKDSTHLSKQGATLFSKKLRELSLKANNSN